MGLRSSTVNSTHLNVEQVIQLSQRDHASVLAKMEDDIVQTV